MTWRCVSAEKINGRSLQGFVRLVGGNFPNNADIFIVGCIQEAGSYKCTTGNTEIDAELGIQKSSGHIFAMDPPSTNPTRATGNSVSVIVKSLTPDVVTNHIFYGVYPSSFDLATGSQGALQLGTWRNEDNYRNCVAIRWDPFGRVFDSRSLEPISAVKVTIFDKDKTKVNIPGLINPVWTNQAGSFNFYVEPGKYYLEPGDLTGFSFVNNPRLNPKYNHIYTNIYKPNEQIIEMNKAVEIDIPLDSGNNEPYRSEISEMSFNVIPVPVVEKTKLIGQVSHPYTFVTFYQDKNKIGETITDKYGFYQYELSNNKIKQDAPITPRYAKYELYKDVEQKINKNSFLAKLTLFINNIFGKKTTRGYDRSADGKPISLIPHYIEGYFYDSMGNVIKDAKINVVLPMSNQVYYQAKSDKTGFVMIKPKNLPIFEYYLEAEIPGTDNDVVVKKTEEFIQDNKNYLEKNNINLITATKNGESVAD